MFGLSEKNLEIIREIFKKYPIKRKVIFGSRARGEYRYNSDIDIPIPIFGDINRRSFISLKMS